MIINERQEQAGSFLKAFLDGQIDIKVIASQNRNEAAAAIFQSKGYAAFDRSPKLVIAFADHSVLNQKSSAGKTSFDFNRRQFQLGERERPHHRLNIR